MIPFAQCEAATHHMFEGATRNLSEGHGDSRMVALRPCARQAFAALRRGLLPAAPIFRARIQGPKVCPVVGLLSGVVGPALLQRRL